MRNILLFITIALGTLGFTVNDAAAKGFGGGRGFGMMRAKSAFTQAPRAPKATPAASKQAPYSKWRGALTGLLLGSLLTSLFMGHGLGGALFSWFIVGATVYFIMSFLRRRRMNELR